MYKPQDIKRCDKYGSNYWEVFSTKINRIVKLFSDLEYENYILIETNPKIETFCEQPVRLKTIVDNKETTSIIDMWLKYKNGKEAFIEVKYQSDINPTNPKAKRSIRQINAQRKWCKDNGFEHIIMTEKEIRGNQILLMNMKSILYYIRHHGKPIKSHIDQIQKIIEKQKITISEIINQYNEIPTAIVFESLSWMFYMDIINMNLESKELNLETEVWVKVQILPLLVHGMVLSIESYLIQVQKIMSHLKVLSKKL